MAHVPVPVRRGSVWTYEDFNLSIYTLPVELLDQIMDYCSYHYIESQDPGSPMSYPTLHRCAVVSRTISAAAHRALGSRLAFSGTSRSFYVNLWYSQPDFIRSRYPPARLYVHGMDVFSTALAGISSVPTIRTLVIRGTKALHWNLISHPSLAAVKSLSIQFPVEPVDDNEGAWEGEPPELPFSLRKLELGHVDRDRPMSETLLRALVLASPNLTTLSLTSMGRGYSDVEPHELDAFVAIFPLVAAKLKRLDLDSMHPPLQLFPHLHLCTSIEHLTIRFALTIKQSSTAAQLFYNAFPPANVVRRLEIHPLDPYGGTGEGYGLGMLARLFYFQQQHKVFPLLESVVLRHCHPGEIALADETRELVDWAKQVGVAVLDYNHVPIVPVRRIPPPPPPALRPPPKATGAYGLFVRNVLPAFGMDDSSTKEMVQNFRCALEDSWTGKVVNVGFTVALYFSGYPDY